MALGLPVILFTAFVHHGAHQAMTMAHLTPGGSPLAQSTLTRLAVRASPWVNWRRTTIGGVAALGVLALLVVGYMASRALGIGPAASLMGAGVLGAKEKLIIADFKSPATDTTLGPVVTEAFRSDLAQSANLDVVPQTTVREVLRRMQRPADARLDYALGREIATREGVKAVIDGEVLSLGGSYVIAAKLYAAQTGEVLASFRATAEQAKDIIPAIDQLSREVRTKVGESLRSINAAPPLQQVTTPSLEALKKYVQGVRVFAEGADFDKGVSLMEEAIALDTGFAMAYRKLGIEFGNHGGMTARQVDLIQKAYDHRARLSEPERYLTEATYWANGPHQDARKAIAAYEALLELQPDNTTALNNVALQYNLVRQFAKGEVAARRAVTVNPNATPYWQNLMFAQVDQGKLSDADKSLEEFGRHLPGSVLVPDARMRLAWARERFDSVSAMLAGFAKSGRTEANMLRVTAQWTAALADLHGQLRAARTASASRAARRDP
jgi:tetratricopeptide (TPR) repeat protein